MKQLRYIYQTSSIDFWGGWTPLAKMQKGDLTFFDFSVKYEEYLSFLDSEQSADGCYINQEELQNFAQEYLYIIYAHKDFIVPKKANEYNTNEMTDEGVLFYSAVPDDGIAETYLILAYKIRNNGVTYIGTPVKMSWLEGMGWEVRDLQEEKEQKDREHEKSFFEVSVSILEKTKNTIDKLITIIDENKLREAGNMDYVCELYNLSTISEILKNKGGFDYRTYVGEFESIYFRDLKGEKITDLEVKKLYKLLIELKPLVDFCILEPTPEDFYHNDLVNPEPTPEDNDLPF